MAFSEELSNRVREIIATTHDDVEEKRMFGGLCFMVDGKMCVGVVKEKLMVRINPDLHDRALDEPFCEPMDFTGKSMKGFVFVDPAGLQSDIKLKYWVQLALDFNPLATASKKKKK